MLNLIKYEYRKTITSKLVSIGVLMVAEIIFLIGCFIMKNTESHEFNSWLSSGIGILTVASVVILIFVTYESAFNLYKELSTKNGYMLFMIPQGKSKILLSKMLVGAINIVLVGLGILLLAFIDITILLKCSDQVENIFDLFDKIIKNIYHLQVDWSLVFSVAFNMVAGLIFSLTCGALAVLIGHLAGIEKGFLKGLVTFGSFIAISTGVQMLALNITKLFVEDERAYQSTSIAIDFVTGQVTQMSYIMGGIYLLISVAAFAASAWLMDNKVSL